MGKSTSKKFYVTAPIYYANAKPHIGNAYTSFIADFYARAKRLAGYDVKFLMGTDENGQKMIQKAEEANMKLEAFLDKITGIHRQVWDDCMISYTDFIRTTEERHHKFVQKMLQKTYDRGDIYKGEYIGKYCIGCESFKKESDLIEKDGKLVCPDHLTEPEEIEEENWFFKLSKYEDKVKKFYKENPNFCTPQFRFNEIISFVEQGLEDFSISREGSKFGVKLPFDDNAVTYIWFDALYNYLTVCQGGDEAYWNEGEVLHVLGKDISRFHAIYWPAMLMSSEWRLPDREIINGFFTLDGKKMSKSLGNVLYPDETISEHGRDALVYYLFSDIKIGNDGDFSHERFIDTKENVLKKGWGNLVSRVVTLAKKNDVTQVSVTDEQIERLRELAQAESIDNPLLDGLLGNYSPEIIDRYLDETNIIGYLRQWFQLVQLGNKFVDETKPWKTAKENPEQAKADLQVLLWMIKTIGVFSAPFLVEAFEKLKDIIQIDHPSWKLLQTEKNLENREEFTEIIALQEFDSKFGESKYLY